MPRPAATRNLPITSIGTKCRSLARSANTILNRPAVLAPNESVTADRAGSKSLQSAPSTQPARRLNSGVRQRRQDDPQPSVPSSVPGFGSVDRLGVLAPGELVGLRRG